MNEKVGKIDKKDILNFHILEFLHLEDLDKKSGKFKILFSSLFTLFFSMYPGCPHSHSSRIGKENQC